MLSVCEAGPKCFSREGPWAAACQCSWPKQLEGFQGTEYWHRRAPKHKPLQVSNEPLWWSCDLELTLLPVVNVASVNERAITCHAHIIINASSAHDSDWALWAPGACNHVSCVPMSQDQSTDEACHHNLSFDDHAWLGHIWPQQTYARAGLHWKMPNKKLVDL